MTRTNVKVGLIIRDNDKPHEVSECSVEHLTPNILAHGDEPQPEHGHRLLAGQVVDHIFLSHFLLGSSLLLLLLILLLLVFLLRFLLLFVVLSADVEQLLDLENVAGAGVGADLHQGNGGLSERLRQHLQGGNRGLGLVLFAQMAEADSERQILSIAVLHKGNIIRIG